MPLLRTYDAGRRTVTTSLHGAYLDRLSRWSDIIEYLPLLYDVARSYPQARVLELGSRTGNSTLALLAGAEESGGHVWSCDIDDVTADPGGMARWAACGRWTFIRGDDMHPAVRAKLPAQVDVLFVDTSHEYEHTVRELEAYMPRVVPGGVALFHDTNFLFGCPGDEWDGTLPPVGRAVDEWCAATGKKWADLPGQYGMGIIRA